MDKVDLLRRISDKSYKYDDVKLRGWVNALPSHSVIGPLTIKVGDVFMHPVFMHPYVFLGKQRGHWLCTLFTSDKDFKEILCPCESRFFHIGYISKVLFTMTVPIGKFMGVYDNTKHLKLVLKNLKEILG